MRTLLTPHASHTGLGKHGRSQSIMWRSSESISDYFNSNIDNNPLLKKYSGTYANLNGWQNNKYQPGMSQQTTTVGTYSHIFVLLHSYKFLRALPMKISHVSIHLSGPPNGICLADRNSLCHEISMLWPQKGPFTALFSRLVSPKMPRERWKHKNSLKPSRVS